MDEAGNTGRNCGDPLQPIHLILTVAIDELRIATLQEHIRETARRFCPQHCEEPDFEFHGKELYAGSGPFRDFAPQRRIEIYDAVLEAIAKSDAGIIIRGVEKAGLQRRYARPFHPHDIALMFTIESIERMARDVDCRVLLIADEAKEVQDAALRDLASYQEFGTSWGWATERIDRIVDTIHFVPSHTNVGIQLADCAAYVAARIRKIRAGIVPAHGPSAEAVERLWETRVLPHVQTDEVWYPP